MPRFQIKATIPLVCVAIVIGIAVALFSFADVTDEAQPGASSVEDAQGAAIRRALTGEAHASSRRYFLRDLERGVEKTLFKASETSVSYAVAWNEQRGLQEVSRDVLETYRKQDGYSVATSGYLDIKGNVWGALLTKEKASVDVVMVTCDEEDSECTARVVRLVPTGKDGAGDG